MDEAKDSGGTLSQSGSGRATQEEIIPLFKPSRPVGGSPADGQYLKLAVCQFDHCCRLDLGASPSASAAAGVAIVLTKIPRFPDVQPASNATTGKPGHSRSQFPDGQEEASDPCFTLS